MREKETIKLQIHTPIYNKKDTIIIFTELSDNVNEINRNKTTTQFGNEETLAAPV